jgi:spore coat protein U-like protein
MTLLAAMVLCSGAAASTATSNFVVKATSNGGCEFTTTSFTLDFGAYSPLATTETTGSTDIKLNCTKDQAYNYYITGTREMTSTKADGQALTFKLYEDASYEKEIPTVKTDGFGGTGKGIGEENVITQTIYGVIAKNQDVKGGVTDWQADLTVVLEY